MALSTGRALHIDTYLSNVAVNYRPQDFIADQIAPIVNVPKETGLYPIFSRMEFYAYERTERARGTEANKITRSVGSGGYAVKNYALGYDVPIEDYANMDAAYEAELGAGASRYLVGKLYQDYERRVATLANAAASVSTTFVPNSSWSGNTANAGDPFGAVMAAKEQQKAIIGVQPNSILVGWKAHATLMRNYHMRNIVKGVNNGGGIVTRQNLADLFEVDRYIVSDVMGTTQNEATVASSLSLTPAFSADKIILYYRPAAPSRDEPSWMYAFRWNDPRLPTPLAVERHPYDTRRKIVGIEAGYYQDEKVTGPEYAVAIAGVNSAQSNGI
jgi:hypothetical protein